MRTKCDECNASITITTVDADGDLIGDECTKCGYYVTRYTPEFREDADWL